MDNDATKHQRPGPPHHRTAGADGAPPASLDCVRTERATAALHAFLLACVDDGQHWQCVDLAASELCKLERWEREYGADDWTRGHYRYLRSIVNYAWAIKLQAHV